MIRSLTASDEGSFLSQELNTYTFLLSCAYLQEKLRERLLKDDIITVLVQALEQVSV